MVLDFEDEADGDGDDTEDFPMMTSAEVMELRANAWAAMTPAQRKAMISSAIGKFLDYALDRRVAAARWG